MEYEFEYFVFGHGNASVKCDNEPDENFTCGAHNLYSALESVLNKRDQQRHADGFANFKLSEKKWKKFKQICQPE